MIQSHRMMMCSSPQPPAEPGQDAIELLNNYLANLDEACPSCAYNLRDLKGAACPECGQVLRLRVGLESPNLAPFITGLVGISAALGFCGTMLVYGVIMSVFGRRWGLEWSDLLLLWFELVINGVLLALWVRASGRVRRQTVQVRWSLAIACWLLPPLTFGLFITSV